MFGFFIGWIFRSFIAPMLRKKRKLGAMNEKRQKRLNKAKANRMIAKALKRACGNQIKELDNQGYNTKRLLK